MNSDCELEMLCLLDMLSIPEEVKKYRRLVDEMAVASRDGETASLACDG